MDFFNKLGKKASETYQVTKEKTAKFSEEIKIKSKINGAKDKIADLYKEIGENVYNQYKTGIEEGKDEISAKCEEISKEFDQIAQFEIDLLSLKEVKKCVSCGAELNKKDDFCSKCGTEQPKQEEKVEIKEETEVGEVQEAEVTEVKDAQENKVENEDKKEEN